MNIKMTACALAATALMLSLQGCGREAPQPQATRATGKTMGTFYSVQVSGKYKEGPESLQKDCDAQFKKITDAISTFDKDAELAKVDADATTEPIRISHYLAGIIRFCQEQSSRVGYAMDVSVGPLVNLWGFGPGKRSSAPPSDEEIARAKALTGPGAFKVFQKDGADYLQKSAPDVRIDLSTVGEGLGADAAADMLDAQGVENYLASVAGASRSKGRNPSGADWKIGIEDPSNPDHNVFQAVCPLGMAMSTAGSYRNYFKDSKTGKIFSHAIDPKTGRPVEHSTMSVTVIAKTAFETDALDTGLLVLGADEALRLANREGMAIFTIEMKDGKPLARYSKAFAPYLKCAGEVNAALEEAQ
ncbi:MAG: FAD:protein FMN transferase [Succinivibrio sp.]